MSAAPQAVTALNEGGASRFVLLCEHASNYIPPEYDALGLQAAELERHIAYDIGAANLARRLSALLDAPLFLAGYSRLLIDLNRPWRASSSIPEISEATVIPGNIGIDAAERARRQAAWFTPFHDRVAGFLETRPGAMVIGVHSFTPVYLGEARPWHAGILYGEAKRFGTALVRALAEDPALVIGDNEPYRIELEYDYTVPVHGDARGRDAVLLEVRQNLLGDDAGCEAWASRLSAALAAARP